MIRVSPNTHQMRPVGDILKNSGYVSTVTAYCLMGFISNRESNEPADDIRHITRNLRATGQQKCNRLLDEKQTVNLAAERSQWEHPATCVPDVTGRTEQEAECTGKSVELRACATVFSSSGASSISLHDEQYLCPI
jgi:hypothetical protein